jgi:hypothetical protein
MESLKTDGGIPSFQRAHSLAWLERPADNREVKSPNLFGPTTLDSLFRSVRSDGPTSHSFSKEPDQFTRILDVIGRAQIADDLMIKITKMETILLQPS